MSPRWFALGQRLVILNRLESDGALNGAQLLDREPSLPRGTIYTTLRRLKNDGLVTARTRTRKGLPGPPRRYYKITTVGRNAARLGRLINS